VAREIAEELGVGVRVGPKLTELVHAYPDRTVRLSFYMCEITSGRPEARGCAAFVWVAPEALKDYPFPEANAGLVAELGRGGLEWFIGPARESRPDG
jgi:mutator protein MutT